MFRNFKRKRLNNNSFLKKTENIENINTLRVNKKQNPFFRMVKLTIWIFIILGAFIYKGYYDFKNDSLITKETIIEINKGDIAINIAKKLNINENYLRIYLKNNNSDFKIITGKFKIEKGANIKKILNSLTNPIIENELNVTILEGWNIYDIDKYLTKKGLIKENEYISYVENLEKIEQLSDFFPFIKGVSTLEGFLYPDTYTIFSKNFKINLFVIKQLENFEKKVYKKILSNISNKELLNLINLASIVEKEEKNKAEKPIVAGILKKRLDNGWMIGADITVCYPYKLTANECKMVITKYINIKSEYNTRKMRGLPKTPIGNPNFETINATLNFKKTPYWFYLHDIKTGKIYYAKTNQGHAINKSRYLR